MSSPSFPTDSSTPPSPSSLVESPPDSFSPSISPSSSPTTPVPSTPSNPPTTSPPSPVVDSPTNTPTSPVSPSSTPPNSSNPPRPSGLRVGFYQGLCPTPNVDVEATITTKVQQLFSKDATLLPALLRMQFHDCFVHGCDASILLDGPSSEKTAGPNLSVRGYEFIDTLKSVAEEECPDVVSCADIIAIATKELIKLGGGPGYSLQTGRKDGLVSTQDVKLPSPFATVTESILAFGEKNFNPEEMLLLIAGGHTIGKSHCSFFQDRLYEGTSQFDPNMDSNLREQLSGTCPQGTNSDNFTFLDQNPLSSSKFDNSFLDQLLNGRGILPIDQALSRDSQTSSFVLQYAQNPALFNAKFASVMIKLQALDVLLGDQGQIRKVCSKVN
uniref:Peroxidase n=2 Tax=Chenopodium quinoa TaxID=63459 RepID=A0A803LVC5_CHEQI